MEGDCDFKTHLHNGDPLSARTVQEPTNRPKTGAPPFSWEFSAEDALYFDKLDVWTDWSVPGMLYKMEGFNGYAYHSLGINSPYLWSFSNHYYKREIHQGQSFQCHYRFQSMRCSSNAAQDV